MELTELRNEIQLEVAGSVGFEYEAFARVFARHLENSERVFDPTIEVLQCRGPKSRRLELIGYAEDPTDNTLTILAGRYFGDDQTLTLTEARDVLKRATGFIEKSLDGWLEENLEISSRESSYAEYFRNRFERDQVSRIRAILITDGLMSERIKTIDSEVIAGYKCSYEIWDQKRILDADVPERGSEDIHIDFTKWLPEGLPCLVAEGSGSRGTPTILAVIPAPILVAVFEEYGSLLLESNVRTFLSARGAVNKGIQATLATEPSKFLSYNNGLTTTASNVAFADVKGSKHILSLDKWQIVNGGQTTASLAHFVRGDKNRSVDDAFIQMKLVIVGEAEASTVVQSVAKYANSQNRVSAADLFSTHEFHVRMEQISRRLKAPAREGVQYRTGWFYERARGQWENDRAARGSAAEQKKFELEFPRAQRITKTDWAKYTYCWLQKPHTVSKGAQSVFAEFAQDIDAKWEKADADFNDGYFRDGVALAILFETLRASVMRADWYRANPGYLANIIAYAISRFSRAIADSYEDKTLDLSKIWKNQGLSETTRDCLLGFARSAQEHLTDPSRPQANVTQWAKQLACWDALRKREVPLPDSINEDLIATSELKEEKAEQRKLRTIDSGFEAVTRVVGVPKEVWGAISSNGKNLNVSPMEQDLIRGFANTGKVPSEKQAMALLRMLERFQIEGVVKPGSY